MVSRRHYLSLVPATALAGCLGSDSDPLAPFGEVKVLNLLERPVTASILIEKEGEVHYNQEYQLRGFEDDSSNQEEHDKPLQVTVSEPWMAEEVNYTVTCEVPNIGTRSYTSEQFGERFKYNENCWGLEYHISESGGSEELEQWISGSAEGAVQCPKSESS